MRWGLCHRRCGDTVCFNLLVDAFSFSVRLGMVGSREGKVISKGFSELLGKGRGELGTTFRDDFVLEAELGVDFVEEEGSDTRGSDDFLGRA